MNARNITEGIEQLQIEPAAADEDGAVMASVGRGIPAIVISVRGEVEWARLLKWRAHPLLAFGIDTVDTLDFYRIFGTGALACFAFAIVERARRLLTRVKHTLANQHRRVKDKG